MKNKLKNENGASIIIALVFFLICASVGASILAAAKANSSRLVLQKKTEQAYLTVRSAAMLIADTLTKPGEPIAVHTVTETTYSDGSTSTDESWSKKYKSFDASLNHKIYDSVYGLMSGTGTGGTFNITISKDGLDDVSADITVSEKDGYHLNSVLRLKGSKTNDYDYIMNMSMTAKITSSETVTEYTDGDDTIKQTDTVYTLNWINVNYKNG
ncbi:MAG: hypothetical protein LKJ75_06940 [Clostridia bacterium]|jgi:hypothetical protein|nr:hypothetical protein [Clostridia bacterium]MCI2014920.1 hypothetical protein [Clostridia bacterium]